MKFVSRFIENCFLFFQSAKLVSEDYYGNQYYLLKAKDFFGRNIRYVKYFDRKESSAIPPLWSAWLKYYFDDIDKIKDMKNPSFVKNHSPNITGVKGAYFPTDRFSGSFKKKEEVYHSWIEG